MFKPQIIGGLVTITAICAYHFWKRKPSFPKAQKPKDSKKYQIQHLDSIEWTATSHDPNIKKQWILPNGLIPHVNGLHHSIFKPGQRVDAHKHLDMHETFVVLNGTGLFILDGEEHHVSKGSVVYIEPHIMHEVVNNSKEEDLELMYFGVY